MQQASNQPTVAQRDVTSRGDALFEQWTKEREEQKKKKMIKDKSIRNEASPWLSFTRWDSHLAGFEREAVLMTIRPAEDEMEDKEEINDQRWGHQIQDNNNDEIRHDEDEDEGLAVACRATRRLIRKSMAVCQPEIVSRSALEFVNRRETGESRNEKPFYGNQKVKTIRKYSRVWIKILRYIWRTGQREREGESKRDDGVRERGRERERGGDDGVRPSWVFTQQQERHYQMMVSAARDEDERQQGGREEQEAGSSQRARGSQRAGDSQRAGASQGRKDQQQRPAEETSREDQQKRQEKMEQHCLRFWMTMFDHELRSSEYDSGIISGLAVLGLDTQNGGWMPVENFTPLLSALVTVARAMVVYTAYRHRLDAIQKWMERGFDQRGAEEQAPSQFEVVQQMVQKFMTLTDFGGMPSPMDRILHMRTYGMKIRFTTKGEGRVSWVGDMVSIDKISFRLGELRAVVHGLNETLRQKLMKDLMLIGGNVGKNVKMPELDLQALHDNAAEMAEEWNFTKDPRNEWEVDGKRWMWDRIFKEDGVEKMFVDGGLEHITDRRQIRWNEKGVEDYFRQVRKFKEGLFVLVHMTAGAPARGTEVISIQHENGEFSRAQRGIFIDRGLVQFVTSYHKGYSANQRVKIIHRYVPKEVGELVVYYIWLVEPFVRILQSMVRGQEEFSSYLWEPEAEEGWKEGEDEEEGDSDGDGDEDEEGVDECDTDEMGDEHDVGGEDGRQQQQQQHHQHHQQQHQHQQPPTTTQDGSRTPGGRKKREEAKNVDGFWNTDRVRRVMTHETTNRIGVKITTAIWRQVYPAIQRAVSYTHLTLPTKRIV